MAKHRWSPITKEDIEHARKNKQPCHRCGESTYMNGYIRGKENEILCEKCAMKYDRLSLTARQFRDRWET